MPFSDKTQPDKNPTESQKQPTKPLPEVPGSINGTVADSDLPAEHGGRAGPDPTRYGDWEKNGRCIDF